MKKTFNRQVVGRLLRTIGRFLTSKVGGMARLLLFCVLVQMVGATA